MRLTGGYTPYLVVVGKVCVVRFRVRFPRASKEAQRLTGIVVSWWYIPKRVDIQATPAALCKPADTV